MRAAWPNKGAAASRRPGGQSDGSGGFRRDHCSRSTSPAAVAEFGRGSIGTRMTTHITSFVSVGFALLLSGCAHNPPAAQTSKTSFVPDVMRAIETAPQRPVTVTASQREQLLALLHGSLRRDFTSASLGPDILAS